MPTKSSLPKVGPWGDDNHEKLSDKPVPTTIGFAQQLKGLVNTSAMVDQLFNQSKFHEQAPKATKEQAQRRNGEVVLFSRASKEQNEDIVKETQVIMQKLKEQIVLLEKAEKNLSADITKVKVEQMPRKTGIYYIRFLEWLLTVVQQLRVRVQEGHAWLETFNQRKKKKMGYWKMYKKHGTTFGLSHERSLATQTG